LPTLELYLMSTAVFNQAITETFFNDFEVELYIKREDLLHPYISGNKFRKLKYNIAEAQQLQQKTLLTFGGAYSNHIHATAYAGKKNGLKTIGIIRGDELGGEQLEKTLSQNKTLAFAKAQGMHLHFISRSNYKLKNTPTFIERLKQQFGDFYLLPEGGTNDLAVKGCTEILTPQDSSFSHICCAVGTGGTVTGIINSSHHNQHIIGFPVLKETYLDAEVSKKVTNTNWHLNRNAHLGGYAKVTPELVNFINSFYKKHQIALDPIYTGKLLFGIYNQIVQGNFPKKSRILAIHTGGLQGTAGVNARLEKQRQKLINTNYDF